MLIDRPAAYGMSIALLCATGPQVMGAPQIERIPVSPYSGWGGLDVMPTSVSADGRVIAGRTSTDSGMAAFHWERGSDPVIIPALSHDQLFPNRWPWPRLSPNSELLAMNSDFPYGGDEIWSSQSGLVRQPGDWRATNVLDSGTVVGSVRVGDVYFPGTWTENNATLFPSLSGATNARVHDSDSTGQRVVGVTYRGTQSRATLWNAGGALDLGSFTGQHESTATAISESGEWVVVQAGPSSSGRFDSYLWSAATGAMKLPEITDALAGTGLAAWSVSNDGIVVGTLRQGFYYGSSFIYSPEFGSLTVQQYLLQTGANVDEFFVSRIYAISADGTTLVGTGYENGTNVPAAIVITIPAPSTAASLLAVGYTGRKRRRRRS